MVEKQKPHQRFRIVFVEEDRTLADITAFRLELLGYEVWTYPDAEQGLPAILDQPPDAVIIDLQLPAMTGLQMIERIASDKTTSGLPVMALSVDAELDVVQQAYMAGATDFLVAPFNPAVLEEKVEHLLTGSPETR